MTGRVSRIESAANPSVKIWSSLHKRRQRDVLGKCLIEGGREMARAVAGGVTFDVVLLGDAATDSERQLAATIAGRGAEWYRLGPSALGRVSHREHPAQILGVAAAPEFSLTRIEPSAAPLILVGDSIEKPGNIGAMIRSAAGAGVDALLSADPVTDLVNPNVIRASQGAVFSIPIAAAPAREVQGWLSARAIHVVAATAEAATAYWDADLTGPLAIVIGSEHAGLSPIWRGGSAVSIPMVGGTDSLNASAAAAILLYEAKRQRR